MFEPPYIFQQHLLGDGWFTPFSGPLYGKGWNIDNTSEPDRVTSGPQAYAKGGPVENTLWNRLSTLGNLWWRLEEDSARDDEEELSDSSGDVTDEDPHGHGYSQTLEYPQNVDMLTKTDTRSREVIRSTHDRNRGFREIPIQFERAGQKSPTHKLSMPEKLSRFIDLSDTEDELTPCPNDNDLWIPNLKLTMKDKRELEEGRMLTDKHIYAAQQLLKQQFPWVSGLQDTCLSQTNFSKINSEGVQIHHTRGNHWVVSACIGGRVQVFDSLYDKLASDLWKQLGEIYSNASEDGERLVVELLPVQRQRGGTDCGLFAIAMAYELCQGNGVLGLHFDQDQMRRHLLRCFQEERLQPFPRRSRATDCLVTNFEVIIL